MVRWSVAREDFLSIAPSVEDWTMILDHGLRKIVHERLTGTVETAASEALLVPLRSLPDKVNKERLTEDKAFLLLINFVMDWIVYNPEVESVRGLSRNERDAIVDEIEKVGLKALLLSEGLSSVTQPFEDYIAENLKRLKGPRGEMWREPFAALTAKHLFNIHWSFFRPPNDALSPAPTIVDFVAGQQDFMDTIIVQPIVPVANPYMLLNAHSLLATLGTLQAIPRQVWIPWNYPAYAVYKDIVATHFEKLPYTQRRYEDISTLKKLEALTIFKDLIDQSACWGTPEFDCIDRGQLMLLMQHSPRPREQTKLGRDLDACISGVCNEAREFCRSAFPPQLYRATFQPMKSARGLTLYSDMLEFYCSVFLELTQQEIRQENKLKAILIAPIDLGELVRDVLVPVACRELDLEQRSLGFAFYVPVAFSPALLGDTFPVYGNPSSLDYLSFKGIGRRGKGFHKVQMKPDDLRKEEFFRALVHVLKEHKWNGLAVRDFRQLVMAISEIFARVSRRYASYVGYIRV